MDISFGWLRALAQGLAPDLEALEQVLTDRGAPVESVQRVSEGLEGVLVGRVVESSPHPDADHLQLCRVRTAGEPVSVVCGAPNVVVGRCYPFAPAGTTLPGGVAVREVEIRGQPSRGMLLSARELGLGTDHSGLMELPGDPEEGSRLIDLLELDDERLEVEITANRGDLLSHLGIAREVAPGGVEGVCLPDIPGGGGAVFGLVRGAHAANAGGATVRIEAPDLCRRYIGVVIRGVEVGPSPAWLQSRLRAVGLRPINNVVDATNYVLFELGQPLHAFDLSRLEGHEIVVRRPGPREKTFRTLDGDERRLGPEMLLICDAVRPVAVAGVMGGLDSEVDDSTTDVLLECALFDPASIRATRRALGMSTDASYRFERGVDPEGLETAVRRAAEIIVATAGGRCEAEAPDCDPRPWSPLEVRLRLARVERVLGVPFTGEAVTALLEPLGFSVAAGDDGTLRVAVPGWRSYDVRREVDLIEEIARTHGYDAFPEELAPFLPGTVPDHPLFQMEDRLRTVMVGRGFFEAQSPAFAPEAEGEVRVSNPVSREEDHLRQNLLPGLLRRVEHNLSRGVRDVRLFEVGTTFRKASAGQPPLEETRIAAVMTGGREPLHWSRPQEPFDVWDLKDLAETLQAEVWRGGRVEPGVAEGERLAEGFRVLDGAGGVVGWAGRVAPDVIDAPAWAGSFWAVELGLPAVPERSADPVFEPLAAYPRVERDFALLVPRTVGAGKVLSAIRISGGELLVSVSLFDRYEGRGIPEGTRSLGYRVRFQSPVRTLTDEEVDRLTERIVDDLREELGVGIRV